MPTSERSPFVVHDGKLHIKLGHTILKEFGPVIGAQCHKEKLCHLKVSHDLA